MIIETPNKVNFMPGGGSGSLDDMIRTYIAWGRNFIILLDADREGKKQKTRYLENFGSIMANRVFSLEDIDPTWNMKGSELLLSESDRMAIQAAAYPESSSFNKNNFNRAAQELCLTRALVPVGDGAKRTFDKIIKFSNEALVKLVGS